MTNEIQKLYQEIGEQSLAATDSLSGRLLLYAEVEQGVISADLFYLNDARVVRYRICPKPLQSLVYALWERWRTVPENSEWRVLCYSIDGGKFNIDLSYPDQLDDDEELSDRRPRAIKKYFGDTRVDYSKPRG